MFVNNQRLVWQPDKEEIKQPWEGIESVEAKHNPRARWIRKVRTEMEAVQQQEDLNITVEEVRSALRKVSN